MANPSTHNADGEYQGVVHEYDGILEHDNRLPRWWLMTLFGAVVFSVVYWLYFHTFDTGPGLASTYNAEWAAHEDARLQKEASQPLSDASLLTLSANGDAVTRGKAAFTTTCAACHAQNGEGLVGPNLTDAAWIHGNTPMEIYKVVSEGVIAKGMPGWKQTLGDQATKDVVAFVLTLKGKNLPGKAPEGVDPSAPPPAPPEGTPPATPEGTPAAPEAVPAAPEAVPAAPATK